MRELNCKSIYEDELKMNMEWQRPYMYKCGNVFHVSTAYTGRHVIVFYNGFLFYELKNTKKYVFNFYS